MREYLCKTRRPHSPPGVLLQSSRCAMRLSESIGIYVDRKRANGVDFSKGQQTLQSFRKSVGDLTLDGITCQHLLGFLDGLGTSTTTWRSKHSLLCHFFEYWISRDQMQHLILPAARPPQPTKFVPFIYTKAEIHSLLHAVRSAQRHEYCSLDAVMTLPSECVPHNR